MKHLEYEHKNNLDLIAIEGENSLAEEEASHEAREKGLKLQKKEYKVQIMSQ